MHGSCSLLWDFGVTMLGQEKDFQFWKEKAKPCGYFSVTLVSKVWAHCYTKLRQLQTLAMTLNKRALFTHSCLSLNSSYCLEVIVGPRCWDRSLKSIDFYFLPHSLFLSLMLLWLFMSNPSYGGSQPWLTTVITWGISQAPIYRLYQRLH